MSFTPTSTMPGIEIRYTTEEDLPHFIEWLKEPKTLRQFPLTDDKEIEDAAKRWIDFYKEGYNLTAVYEGVPVGIGILFVQNYTLLRHQCTHILLVAEPYRHLEIGHHLHEELVRLAKERFGIELIHVEVYGAEEAVTFYRQHGYDEFGRQEGWIKDGTEYLERVLLERFI